MFYALHTLYPVPDMDQIDAVDVYGTFTDAEARRIPVALLDEEPSAFAITGIPVKPGFSEKVSLGEKVV